MRVMSVIELPEGTYQVNSVFHDRELAVVVESGLRALLKQGAMPFQQIGKVEEKIFRAFPPSEVMQQANAEAVYQRQQESQIENPSTGHRDSAQCSPCVGAVEPERGDQSNPSLGVRPVLGGEVVGERGYDVLLDPAERPETDAPEDTQAP